MIPYGRQDITQTDIDAVVEVLRSDFLTQGPAVPRFEHAVASLVNADYAIAVNSATSALHIACLALELGPDDRLWTVPNTFVASANCGRYCGAEVDFVDIDPRTWNLSVPKLREKLAQAKLEGRLPSRKQSGIWPRNTASACWKMHLTPSALRDMASQSGVAAGQTSLCLAFIL